MTNFFIKLFIEVFEKVITLYLKPKIHLYLYAVSFVAIYSSVFFKHKNELASLLQEKEKLEQQSVEIISRIEYAQIVLTYKEAWETSAQQLSTGSLNVSQEIISQNTLGFTYEGLFYFFGTLFSFLILFYMRSGNGNNPPAFSSPPGPPGPPELYPELYLPPTSLYPRYMLRVPDYDRYPPLMYRTHPVRSLTRQNLELNEFQFNKPVNNMDCLGTELDSKGYFFSSFDEKISERFSTVGNVSRVSTLESTPVVPQMPPVLSNVSSIVSELSISPPAVPTSVPISTVPINNVSTPAQLDNVAVPEEVLLPCGMTGPELLKALDILAACGSTVLKNISAYIS